MGDLHQQTLNVLWLQGQLAVLALVLDWDGLQTIMLFLGTAIVEVEGRPAQTGSGHS